MKKILKQRGFYAVLAAAVLITAALVMTCINPVDVSSLQGAKALQIPEGKGALLLSFGNDARTILPEEIEGKTNDEILSDLYFSVVVIDTADDTIANATAIVGKDQETTEGTPIILVTGAYDVWVLAAFEEDADPVFVGKSLAVPVTAGVAKAVPITMGKVSGNDYDNESFDEEGTFSFKLDIPDGDDEPDGGTVAVIPFAIGIGGTPTWSTPLAATGGTELVSGYYFVRITYNKATYYKTNTITWMLHIYPTLTSELEVELPKLVKNLFVVTYNPGTGGTAGTLASQNVSNGGFAVEPTIAQRPSHLTMDFDEWYEDAGLSTVWDFDTKRVWADTSIYAKWKARPASPGMTVEITLTLSGEDMEPTNTPYTFYISQVDDDQSVTLTIENAGEYDDFHWYFSSSNNPFDSIEDSATLVLENSLDNVDTYVNIGTHVFTVTAEKDDVTYSALFTLTVLP